MHTFPPPLHTSLLLSPLPADSRSRNKRTAESEKGNRPRPTILTLVLKWLLLTALPHQMRLLTTVTDTLAN